MLQSVIATVNRLGLQTLHLEEEAKCRAIPETSLGCSVWAVVDSEDLREVHRALLVADPKTALALLNERAVSIGSLCD